MIMRIKKRVISVAKSAIMTMVMIMIILCPGISITLMSIII
jgi:hypothetical protein